MSKYREAMLAMGVCPVCAQRLVEMVDTRIHRKVDSGVEVYKVIYRACPDCKTVFDEEERLLPKFEPTNVVLSGISLFAETIEEDAPIDPEVFDAL